MPSSRPLRALGPRHPCLAVLFVALLLACAACSPRSPEPEGLPAGLLEGIPLHEPLASALAASQAAERKAGHARPAPGSLAADMEWAGLLDWRREQPGQAESACADLLERWRAEPQRLLWILTAWDQQHSSTDSAGVAATIAAIPEGTLARRVADILLSNEDERRDSLLCQLWPPGPGESLTAEDRLLLFRQVAFAKSTRGEPVAAARELLAVLPEVRAVGGRHLEGRFWRSLADIFADSRTPADLDNAVQANARAAALFLGTSAPHWRLVASGALGQLFIDRRQLDRAIPLLEWTAQRAREESACYAEGYALNSLSTLYLDLGEIGRALAMDRRALALWGATGRRDDLPFLHLNIADDFRLLAELDSARVAMDAAYAAVAGLQHPEARLAVYLDDSDLALLEGDFARADSLRGLAEAELGAAIEPRERILSLLKLAEHGIVSGRLALVDQALSKMEQLERKSTSSHSEDLDFELQRLRARLHLAAGERPLAAAALDSCAALLRSWPATDRSAQFLALRARLLADGGDGAGALAAQTAALDSARASGRPALAHQQELLLGQLLLRMGHPAEARVRFQELGRLLGQASGLRVLQESDYWLARCTEAEGAYGGAVQALRRLIAAEGERLPQDLGVLSLVALGRVEAKRGRRAEAEQAYRDALAAIGDGSRWLERPELRYAASDQLRETICGLIGLALSGQPDAPAVARSLQLRQQLLDLPSGGRETPLQLPAHPTLALLLDEERSWAWILAGGRQRAFALPGRVQLESLAARLRAGIERPERRADTAAAAELGRLLLAPLEPDWPSGTALQVLADGALQGLPWSLLPVGGGLALDRGPIVEIPSLQVAPTPPPSLAGLPLLAFGSNAAAGPGKPRLLRAEGEAAALVAAYPPGRAWRGAEVTAAQLLGAGREEAFLHLAMHSTAGRWSAAQTALALPDGSRLDAEQVATARWRSALVTLATCETRSDGSRDDLPRAFLAGGAQAVLASSLRVPDAEGERFVSAFYGHLRKGLSPEDALRLAQLAQRGGPPERAAPYYWAGYHLLRPAR